MAEDCGFLKLPDEIILQIMRYLTTSDVLTLSRVCRRLSALLPDRTLWMDVDLRQSVLHARQLGRLLRHLQAETRRVCLCGHVSRRPARRPPPLLTAKGLSDIRAKCESLEELRLERCFINASQIPLELLPSSLVTLSLRGCEVSCRPVGRSYFHRLAELTPRLAELDLSACGWVDSHALLPLSKLARLRVLRLRACPRLGGEVAYSSLACMLGFRALEELDVRATAAADSDVSGFAQLPRLRALLLQPRRARRLDGDAALRHLGAQRGAALRHLALRDCRLSEAAAGRLPALLPGLRRLDVSGVGLDADALRRLREALPRCEVSCHGLPRRRPRSPSPPGAAPPAKRRRCGCLGCAAGELSEPEPEEQEPEEEEEEPVDWENQPGVIVVNVFGGWPPRRVGREERDAQPAAQVDGGDEAEAENPLRGEGDEGNVGDGGEIEGDGGGIVMHVGRDGPRDVAGEEELHDGRRGAANGRGEVAAPAEERSGQELRPPSAGAAAPAAREAPPEEENTEEARGEMRGPNANPEVENVLLGERSPSQGDATAARDEVRGERARGGLEGEPGPSGPGGQQAALQSPSEL